MIFKGAHCVISISAHKLGTHMTLYTDWSKLCQFIINLHTGCNKTGFEQNLSCLIPIASKEIQIKYLEGWNLSRFETPLILHATKQFKQRRCQQTIYFIQPSSPKYSEHFVIPYRWIYSFRLVREACNKMFVLSSLQAWYQKENGFDALFFSVTENYTHLVYIATFPLARYVPEAL